MIDRDALHRLGFTGDAGRFRRNGDLLAVEAGWLSLERADAAGGLGAPGLWKDAGDAPVFDLPLEVAPHLADLLAWADATAGGDAPDGWEPPDEVGAGSLTVRVGALTAQGEVVREHDRLALRFDLCEPGDLDDVRVAWLRALAANAGRRWRLVRVGRTNGAVRAEVDLTGAPRDALDPLVRVAAGALRWVTAWLLPPVFVLCDPTAESRALETHSPKGVQRCPKRRKRSSST